MTTKRLAISHKRFARNLVIGLDSGGTKVRGVLMAGNKILKKCERLHPVSAGGTQKLTGEQFMNTLYQVIDFLWDRRVKKIGLGLPGDIVNNKVAAAGRVKALAKLDVKNLLKRKYRAKVSLDNDVKVVLADQVRQLKKYNSIFMITLGTGIGGGWYLNGKIMRGSFSSAYEIGQIVIDKHNLKPFEQKDCAKAFFQVRGIDNPLESERKARHGDRHHQRLWQEFGTNLGVALANVINLIEPEVIVIGGGITHAWSLFIPKTKTVVSALTLSPLARKKVKLMRAKNYKWSGAIGAASLVQKNAK